MMTGGFEIPLVLICMAGAAFFSGVETGVISIDRLRLRHKVEGGSGAARTLQWFLDHSDRLFGTTLVGTNICMVMASIIAASYATALSPAWGKMVSYVMVTLLLLIFSEYLPKAWFRSRPLERCSLFAETLRVSSVVLRPLAATLTWLTRLIVPKSAGSAGKQSPFVTREEIRMMTNELAQNGTLAPEARTMILKALELSGKTADEIMVPRERMTVVNSGAAIPELLRIARESDHMRLPVYDEEKKEFTGIVSILDVLSSANLPAGSGKVADYMHAPQFIPGNMPLDDILPKMRLLRQPMCLVTDAQSQITGVITIQDVLEEIVGKL